MTLKAQPNYIRIGEPQDTGYLEFDPNSPDNDYLQTNFTNNTEDPYRVLNKNYYSSSTPLYQNQNTLQKSEYVKVGRNNNNNENKITYSKKEQQPSEYLTIEQTFSTDVLEEIINWIKKQVK